jgi:alpha-1,3/alpha-1,6-mannosyltransferase
MGNSIFPMSVRGKLTLVCSILRQLHLVLSLALSIRLGHASPDIFVIDQLGACMPLLRWLTNKRAVFYCHFPDLLTSAVLQDPSPRSLIRQMYRMPLDHLEGVTTSAFPLSVAGRSLGHRRGRYAPV